METIEVYAADMQDILRDKEHGGWTYNSVQNDSGPKSSKSQGGEEDVWSGNSAICFGIDPEHS